MMNYKKISKYLIAILLIVSISLNYNLFKQNLYLKKDIGSDIGFIIDLNLTFLPYAQTSSLVSSDNNIDKKQLLKLIGVYENNISNIIWFLGLDSDVEKFARKMHKNLKELYRLIELDSDSKEINIVLNEIKQDREKALNIHEKLDKLIENESSIVDFLDTLRISRRSLIIYESFYDSNSNLMIFLDENLDNQNIN